MHKKPVTQPQTLRQRFVKKPSTLKLSGTGYNEFSATDQLTTLTERCQEHKTYIKELIYRLKKEGRSAQVFNEDSSKVAECFASFHQKLLQTPEIDPILVQCFEKTRDFQINICDFQSKLNTALENKVVLRLTTSTKETGTNIKNSTKNFQKAKGNYEIAVTPSKTKKAKDEQEITAAKEAYFTAGNESLACLSYSSKEFQYSILQSLCDYWDAMSDFYLKSSKWVNNVKPLLANYRDHLNKSREELIINQINVKKSIENQINAKVFGCPLDDIIEREQSDIPKFVKKIIDYLMIHAPSLEGVFRISATKTSLSEAIKKIDSGENIDFDDLPDSHIVPGLLKSYLRELPEPLLTFQLYGQFLRANLIEDKEEQMKEMKRLVEFLPTVNKLVFKYLLFLLWKIADNEQITKMGLSNLSTVITPNILYDKQMNVATMVEDMDNANSIIICYIMNCHKIFNISSISEAAQENDIQALISLYNNSSSPATDIEKADESNLKPIHYAASHSNLPMIQFLLEKNASVDAVDGSGKTALIISCRETKRSQEIAKYLVKAGADPTIAYNGRTALDFAEAISPEFHASLQDVIQDQQTSKMKEESLLLPVKGFGNAGKKEELANLNKMNQHLGGPLLTEKINTLEKISKIIQVDVEQKHKGPLSPKESSVPEEIKSGQEPSPANAQQPAIIVTPNELKAKPLPAVPGGSKPLPALPPQPHPTQPAVQHPGQPSLAQPSPAGTVPQGPGGAPKPLTPRSQLNPPGGAPKPVHRPPPRGQSMRGPSASRTQSLGGNDSSSDLDPGGPIVITPTKPAPSSANNTPRQEGTASLKPPQPAPILHSAEDSTECQSESGNKPEAKQPMRHPDPKHPRNNPQRQGQGPGNHKPRPGPGAPNKPFPPNLDLPTSDKTEKLPSPRDSIPISNAKSPVISPRKEPVEELEIVKKEEIIQEVEPPAPDPTPEPTPEPTPVLTPVPIPVPTPTQVEKEEYKKQLDSPAPAPELPFYFENIKNLHSLVSEDIPLQSVYNLINVSEMTESLILLVKASLPDEYGPNEISQINIALKSSAETLKILFSVVKKFASLFEEDDKKEILINSSHLQNSTRTLIATVKQINANPNDTSQNETLRSIVKEFIDTIYKFFKYCELASSGYVLSTSQLSAEQIAKLLQSLSSPEPFDSSQLNHLASSSLKLSQLVRAKAAYHPVEKTQIATFASVGLMEKSVLELINECKKLELSNLIGTSKANEEITNVAKRALLEYRQINNLLSKDMPETNLSDPEQACEFVQLFNEISVFVKNISTLNFTTDLDKALILQIKIISKKLEDLTNLGSVPPTDILQSILVIIECLKKIRVGINSMEKKSRDFVLNTKLRVWSEAILSSSLVLRLSTSAYLFNLPISRELQLFARFRVVVFICKEFYEHLAGVRGFTLPNL